MTVRRAFVGPRPYRIELLRRLDPGLDLGDQFVGRLLLPGLAIQRRRVDAEEAEHTVEHPTPPVNDGSTLRARNTPATRCPTESTATSRARCFTASRSGPNQDLSASAEGPCHDLARSGVRLGSHRRRSIAPRVTATGSFGAHAPLGATGIPGRGPHRRQDETTTSPCTEPASFNARRGRVPGHRPRRARTRA